MELVTAAEFARRMAVSRQHISKLIKIGKLQKTDGGKLDFEASRDIFNLNRKLSTADLEDWQKEQKGHGAVKAQKKRIEGKKPIADQVESKLGIQFQQARAASQAIRATREKIELDHLQGKLISVESVKHQISTISNIVRTRLNKFPSKYAARLEGLTSIEIQETLEAGIYEILSEFHDMSKDVEGQAGKK